MLVKNIAYKHVLEHCHLGITEWIRILQNMFLVTNRDKCQTFRHIEQNISGWQQSNLKKKHKQHLFLLYFLTSWQTSSSNFLRACLKSANTKWQSLVENMSLELLEVYKSQAQERPPAEVFDAGPEKSRTESTGANQSGHPLKWCGSKWNILCISYDWYDCVNVLISYIITWENKCFHNSTSISSHQTNLNLLLIMQSANHISRRFKTQSTQ